LRMPDAERSRSFDQTRIVQESRHPDVTRASTLPTNPQTVSTNTASGFNPISASTNTAMGLRSETQIMKKPNELQMHFGTNARRSKPDEFSVNVSDSSVRSPVYTPKGVVNFNGHKISDPLLVKVLYKVSEQFGKPVNVTSGDRDFIPKGSTTKSLHNQKEATDFHVDGVKDQTVYDAIKQNFDKFFDHNGKYQVIRHGPYTSTEAPHVHIGRYPKAKDTGVLFMKEGMEKGSGGKYPVDANRHFSASADTSKKHLEDKPTNDELSSKNSRNLHSPPPPPPGAGPRSSPSSKQGALSSAPGGVLMPLNVELRNSARMPVSDDLRNKIRGKDD
jgi:uncharacterized protein YcbK (DUF882 family)